MKLAGGLLALVGKYLYIAQWKKKDWENGRRLRSAAGRRIPSALRRFQ